MSSFTTCPGGGVGGWVGGWVESIIRVISAEAESWLSLTIQLVNGR